MLRFLFIFLLLNLPAIAQKDIPRLKMWATDFTGTLSSDELNQLNSRLKLYQDTTGNQLVVLIIPTLNDYPIEDYAYAVAKENKIGTAKNNNGILLLVAKDDRELRIEVGYGLEGAVPDAISSSIIRNVIIPHFKNNDYKRGISEGLDAIISAIGGEYVAEPDTERKPGGGIFTILFIIFIIIMMFSRGGKGGIGRMILLGGLAGGGFRGGSFGGRSGRSGGFGGFSGGGGSFGGGGASGRW